MNIAKQNPKSVMNLSYISITQGIKYAGSKTKIIPHILSLIEPLEVNSVLDGFSGTTRVSQALKKAGYTVYSNDIAVWSKVFGECYLLNRKPKEYYKPLIDHLNNMSGNYGWFTENYGGISNGGSSIQPDGKKRIWQDHNTRKLDSIREEIDHLAKNSIEKSVLLTSLILALDKVDSTLGHQVSYLRLWAERAYKNVRLEIPDFFIDKTPHKVFNKDIFDLLDEMPAKEVDLAYYDPPYGSSNEKMPPSRVRYGSYYHLWTTICLNDKPKLWGSANRRFDTRDQDSTSIFEDFRIDGNGRFKVVNAIERLVQKTKAKYILLSYSDRGRATRDEIVSLIKNLDLPYSIISIKHKAHVMKSMKWTGEWADNSYSEPTEYLFLISTTGKPLPEQISSRTQQSQLAFI